MKFIPEDLYKKILSVSPIVCVDVYIYHAPTEEFLFFLRTNKPAQGLFCCPGGRVVKNEQLFAAAKRKLHDETGWAVSVNNLRLIGVTDTAFPDSHFSATPCHTINISFLYTVSRKPKVKLNNEHAQYAWLKGTEKGIVRYVRGVIREIKMKKSIIYFRQDI